MSNSLSTNLINYLARKGVWVTKPYQVDGVKWLLDNKRCCLADEQGLGKTCQSLLAALTVLLAGEVTRVVIVCNKSVKSDWQKLIDLFAIKANQFTIITGSHSSLAALPYDSQTAWVIDEAHNYCNPLSLRTKALTAKTAGCKWVWLLTGTPIRNGTYANLLGLLTVAHHPLALDPDSFLHTYAIPSYHDDEVRWFGCRNTDRLKRLLSPFFLRRTKAVLELPPRVNKVVQLNDSEARAWFEKEQAKLAYMEDTGLRKIMLRTRNALAKVNSAVDYLVKLQAEVGKVVVFTNVVEVVNLLEEALSKVMPVVAIHGSTPKRASLVTKFNTMQTGAFVATTKTCGEGVTLTTASDLVILDYPWTASELLQISDRIHRIGQSKPCTCHWLELTRFDVVLFDTVVRKERPHSDLFDEAARLVKTRDVLQELDQTVTQTVAKPLEVVAVEQAMQSSGFML